MRKKAAVKRKAVASPDAHTKSTNDLFPGEGSLRKALERFYTEGEVRTRINGSKQAWYNRREKIREASGLLIGDYWYYHRRSLDQYLEATDKHRPIITRR